MTDTEKEAGKQQGLSKEAWAGISAIAVAVIGGTFTLITALLNPQTSPFIHSSSSPKSTNSPDSPSSPSSIPSPLPSSSSSSTSTENTDASLSAQNLAQPLNAVNIDFSDAKLQDQLSNPSSQYPQFAQGCLKLLSNQRLKNKAYFDVIFWNYTDKLKGKVNSDAPDGDLNTTTLKAAMVEAYNTRNGRNALFFGDIVEPK